MAKQKPSDRILRALRAFGLAYPGAHTKSPWPGHLDLAVNASPGSAGARSTAVGRAEVNDRTFAYLSLEGEPLSISCKLPHSGQVALLLPFCTPTSYGLGKSGWVTASFPAGKLPPVDMLEAWIDESYRAQAPKKLVKQLPGAAPAEAVRSAGPRVARRTASGKRTARGKRRPRVR
jgi:hypothetical protein